MKIEDYEKTKITFAGNCRSIRTVVPMRYVKLLGLEKGDSFIWSPEYDETNQEWSLTVHKQTE